jgi:integrase
MVAVQEGRASRSKKRNKPRTIADKLAIYNCDIAPNLADKLIFDVTEEDLTKLVLAKGRSARVRANRLAGELKVFFGWAASLRGTEIGLPSNPAARLTDLKFPETPLNRILTLDEIGWFLRAVALEPRIYQRGMLLLLLTAARLSEVIFARTAEYREGVWTIPQSRTKNGRSHRIALGRWSPSCGRTGRGCSHQTGSMVRGHPAAGTKQEIACSSVCRNLPADRSSGGLRTIFGEPPAPIPSA